MSRKLLRLAFASALAATAALSTTDADAAGKANGLGDKGELIISADRFVPVFNFTHASASETQTNGVVTTSSRNGTGLTLLWGRNFGFAAEDATFALNVHAIPRVAVDYAIIDHLTLGGAIAFGFGLGGTNKDEVQQGGTINTRETDAPRYTAIGFAPRVGYVIPLTDLLAFWPRGGIGLYSVTIKQDRVDPNNQAIVESTSVSDTLLSLDLDPQLAIVPFEHFFFSVGALINIPITGSRTEKITSGSTTRSVSNDISLFNLGITASIGGWFNL
jgi:hypothetical protein